MILACFYMDCRHTVCTTHSTFMRSCIDALMLESLIKSKAKR